MERYCVELERQMKAFANKDLAVWQRKYMRNKFKFLGVPASDRNFVIKDFLKKKGLPNENNFEKIIYDLWTDEYREMQYAAIQIVRKYQKTHDISLELIEYMIILKSWWDTVDLIAPNIAAIFLDNHLSEKKSIITKWIYSDNIWLKRSAVIFQLRKKNQTDIDLLLYAIEKLRNIDEFFIQKAIAWALREYSKTDAKFVKEYVRKNNFSKFVEREALRYLNKKI